MQPVFIEASPKLPSGFVVALAANLLPGLATLWVFDLAAIGGRQVGQQTLLTYPPLLVLTGHLCLLACSTAHGVSCLIALHVSLGISRGGRKRQGQKYGK